MITWNKRLNKIGEIHQSSKSVIQTNYDIMVQTIYDIIKAHGGGNKGGDNSRWRNNIHNCITPNRNHGNHLIL